MGDLFVFVIFVLSFLTLQVVKLLHYCASAFYVLIAFIKNCVVTYTVTLIIGNTLKTRIKSTIESKTQKRVKGIKVKRISRYVELGYFAIAVPFMYLESSFHVLIAFIKNSYICSEQIASAYSCAHRCTTAPAALFAYRCRLRSYTTKAVAYLFSNYFVSLHMSL